MLLLPRSNKDNYITNRYCCLAHLDKFTGWQMTTHVEKASGTFILLACDGVNHITYPTHMKNNLWYHHMRPIPQSINSTYHTSVINAMSINAIFELWHHRLGHSDKNITEKFHSYTIVEYHFFVVIPSMSVHLVFVAKFIVAKSNVLKPPALQQQYTPINIIRLLIRI